METQIKTMKKFQGTKGDWILRENQSTIMSDENYLIARVFDGKGSILLSKREQSDEIVFANAKLICCAPKMIELLLELRLGFDGWDALPPYMQEKIHYLIKDAL